MDSPLGTTRAGLVANAANIQGKRITDRFNNVRNLGTQALMRWTNNSATSSAAAGTIMPIAAGKPTVGSLTSSAPASSIPISRSIDVDASVLRHLSARSPGCLLDAKYFDSLSCSNISNHQAKYRVTEVQFPASVGLILEASHSLPGNLIYVRGFASTDSPGLVSGAVGVGALIMGASVSTGRWIPNRTTDTSFYLDSFSSFCKEARPLIIRFLRVLPNDDLSLRELHANRVLASSFWVPFLADSDREDNNQASADANSSTTSFEARLALFAVDAREVLTTYENQQGDDHQAITTAIMDLVERHLLPHPRSIWEQHLIEYYKQYQVDASSSATTTSAALLDYLEQAVRTTEEALQVSYFPRFLHSPRAKEMWDDAASDVVSPWDSALFIQCREIQFGTLPLVSYLKSRPLATILIAFDLGQGYQQELLQQQPQGSAAARARILLYTELEFEVAPLLVEAANSLTSQHHQLWVAASRVYERFLAPQGAGNYAGEFTSDQGVQINRAWIEACLAYSAASLDDPTIPSSSTTKGTEWISELQSLLIALQRLVLLSLERQETFWREFAHSELYPLMVESLYPLSSTTTILPRFGALYQNHLPQGLQDHRGASISLSFSTTAALPPPTTNIKTVLKFDTATASLVDAFPLSTSTDHAAELASFVSFCLPWRRTKGVAVVAASMEGSDNSNIVASTSNGDLQPSTEEPSVPLCFPFVVDKGSGKKVYGLTSYNPESASWVLLSDSLVTISSYLTATFPVSSSSSSAREVYAACNTVESPYGPGIWDGRYLTLANSMGLVLPFDSLSSPPSAATKDRNLGLELLLESLSLRNLILVFTALLVERKVLVVGSKFTAVTLVTEALYALLAPFRWSHVYVPLLPRNMLDLLMCPTPFLLGIHTSYAFRSADFPFATDLVVVDLDRDEVNLPSTAAFVASTQHAGNSSPGLGSSFSHLPFAVGTRLYAELKQATSPRIQACDSVGTTNVTKEEREDVCDLVTRAFARTMQSILSGLVSASFSIDHAGERIVVVDEEAWLRGKMMAHSSHLGDDDIQEEKNFWSALVRTQHFSDYLVMRSACAGGRVNML